MMDWNYDMRAALANMAVANGVNIFGCNSGSVVVMHWRKDFGRFVVSNTGNSARKSRSLEESSMPTLEERLEKLTEQIGGDYLKFERVENKFSERPDIHALILLDKLQPRPGRDIISGAEHDIFYLGIDAEKLNEIVTDDQLRDLIRCGVHYDRDGDGLAMFA